MWISPLVWRGLEPKGVRMNDEIQREFQLTEGLIRDRVRTIITRKLSIWDVNTSITQIIDVETENIMKVIRPLVFRIKEL